MTIPLKNWKVIKGIISKYCGLFQPFCHLNKILKMCIKFGEGPALQAIYEKKTRYVKDLRMFNKHLFVKQMVFSCFV